MPLPATIVDAAVLRSGVRTIRAAGRAMLQQARDAGVSGPQSIIGARLPGVVGLEPVDGALVQSVWTRVARDIAWVNDGWCPGRAIEGAQLIADGAHRPLAVSIARSGGMASADDAVAAAVGVLDGPFHLPGGRSWDYHAVTVVQPSNAAEPVVLDGLVADHPITLDSWARMLGRRAQDVQLRHPWDLRGLGVAGSMSEGSQRITEHLEESLRIAAAAGRVEGERIVPGMIRAAAKGDTQPIGRAAAFERRFASHDDRWFTG